MPFGGSTNRPRSTCDLGVYGASKGGSGGSDSDDPSDLGGDGSIGRYCGAVSSPLVRSYGDVGVTNVQKPDAEEPIGRVPCVEEPSHSR
jgi:hypothetical protein